MEETDPWREYRKRRNLCLVAYLGFVPFVFLLIQLPEQPFGSLVFVAANRLDDLRPHRRKLVNPVQVSTLQEALLCRFEVVGLQHIYPTLLALQTAAKGRSQHARRHAHRHSVNACW
jgi:hypothetical protein